MENLIGKHFVITGGTSGLGYALTKVLLERGAKVTLLVRSMTKFKQTFFPHNTHLLQAVQCDLNSAEQIKRLDFAHATINGLIHSAGLGYFKSISAHSEEEMLETYRINVVHFNILLNHLAHSFSEHPYIIGISSLAAHSTQAHSGHYAASKAAFNQVLNTYRLEHPNYHILTVNAGPIRTPFHAKADPTLKYATQVDKLMLDPDKLANQIIIYMLRNKAELNAPKWLNSLLKLYQLAPRKLERAFPKLFNNKKE
ncbi:putative short chain dehydrogenase [Staphylococcus piscifermentans]|uniref:SDR family oxidoreductase n=1 Tax=Staphylococcus piscifermentans TaxID=70258 RepID=A0A239U2K7_9STAP|nr:SDR family NAD(P)-dependent oxidoreductase [Staphylococcus piscifermentans]RTX84618.1 SDR family NAD(P)-dependent oxidoreductase [Staphylococcus piscifermentans]GEP84771.1 SDR family oxidoreductase [Staphylococcus piscifermentans]SNV04092.1 putative short chain dehydrogenase [Staphylococcus piscifermentans]